MLEAMAYICSHKVRTFSSFVIKLRAPGSTAGLEILGHCSDLVSTSTVVFRGNACSHNLLSITLGGVGGGGYCYFLRSDLSTTVTGTFQCLSLGLVEMNSYI